MHRGSHPRERRRGWGWAIAAAALSLTQCTSDKAAPPAAAPTAAVTTDTLRPVAAFAGIPEPRDRSVALYLEAAKVIASPRCLNCHPSGDRPTQGEVMRPHEPRVVRGPDGFGMTAMRCASCHQATNQDQARVPGNPSWHLAPHTMAWQGKTVAEICLQLKDRSRNGDRDLAAIAEHMATDHLVGWAWTPDAGRKPAPGTQSQFGDLIRAWIESGAACPST